MHLYAIVIGKRPKHSPYVAYMEEGPKFLAVFERKMDAVDYKFNNKLKNGRVVRFDEVKP